MSLQAVLVDDDPLALLLLDSLLSNLGIDETQLAGSAQEALALFRSDTTERVCFLDLHMPGMDGLELMRHLAEQKSCVGVVLMSGEDQRILRSAEQLATAQGLRVIAALQKPITVDSLRQTLLKLANPIAVRHPKTAGSGFRASVADLGRALRASELVVHYQPRISLHTGACSGLEALVRWQHPEVGLVGPLAFVPLAERTGLIDLVTHQVFEQGLRDLAELRQDNAGLQLSLNVSIDTLAHLEFAEEVATLAAQSGVPLLSLVVEVTESRLAAQFERVLETLTRLRLRRVGVAIDDFGTGFSSLEQLRRFPFTELKLDRSFVRGAHHDSKARAILSSSVALASQLGMTTVAEGLETQDDWDLVARIGCDEAQGYFMAKPMAKAELRSWLAAWRGPQRATTVAASL